ncbi:glycosyltransferase family 4 protein [Cognatitamlana onchidii]|uniref:glycosyltransferase family 4 protein n=1 Tax=Cognatitamlana onchidii TaxID=2562860 RepID=UPI0010A5FDD8|nr:glycosyltransferase family 4 protein [Algibacter onchidii]
MKKKIIRVTTVPGSLGGLLKGQLKYMSTYYEIIGVSSYGPNGLLQKLSEQEGIKVHAVEMTRTITPFKDIKAVWKLYKVFKKEQPFIVHSHTPKAGTLSMVASWLAGVPHRLHTIAGLPLVEATGFKRFVLNTVETLTYSCATMIYPNSYGLMDIILNNKFTTKKKLKVIGNGSSNGINTNYFNPALYADKDKVILRNKLNIQSRDFTFIFVGRLVGDKGINELISAFIKLKNHQNHIKLVLVGIFEETLDPLLPKTIHRIKSDKDIIEIGWANDVRPYLAIADALAFPSYREGFPNVVMQAGSMGLPCVVSDINGCNEIIENNHTGIIIPPKNTNALYQGMLSLLNNKVEAQNMGNRSRERIRQRYEQSYLWKAILEEYNTLK